MPGLALVARALTLFRFVAIVPFVALLVRAEADLDGGSIILAALYVAVALSDWSDGRLARLADAASQRWGRLDAAADITFNLAALCAAAWIDFIGPSAPLAVAVLGAGFLLRRGEEAPDPPGKLAGVFFYALVGIVTLEAVWPGTLGPTAVRRAADATAIYAAGVVSARLAMSSWRRWTKRSA
jgi:hypothetical protein